MRSLLFGLLCLGCIPTAASTPAPELPIAFVDAPDGLRAWRFDIHGLPATDTRTGEVIVADVAHGNVIGSLSLSILSIRPGAPTQATDVLTDRESLDVLYEMEDPIEEARATTALAGRVRTRTRAANHQLEARALRSLEPCRLAAGEALFCAHPQQLVCGTATYELDGDVLRGPDGSVRTGWAIPAMDIAGPQTMLACIEEAHLDPVTMQLAVRLDHVCEGGGSDACVLPDEWHVIATPAAGAAP